MSASLFVEAFGEVSSITTINEEEEDLYSIFRARSDLMRWANASGSGLPLWSMEEAGLPTDAKSHRIGWVQVGLGMSPDELLNIPPNTREGEGRLRPSTGRPNPVLVLPSLIQCFSDALSRFGSVAMSSVQVTATGFWYDSEPALGYLVDVLNWFNIDLKQDAKAIVAFDEGLLDNYRLSDMIAMLERRNSGLFEFRKCESSIEEYVAKIPSETPYYPVLPQSNAGVLVSMPEWTASAMGWVLGSVLDVANGIEPRGSDFMIRITRT